ncbi:complex I assembly factor TIMMDC1, mitochondrial [Polypterus senegalus]|uniref:complex I assembly factor TIMMDC1, mitochondrial n=1 Tax=Polypterus senegalus TaxID=55291 RepID=UPI001964835D|nr:complex I assembly factor TIMMDC1, mitochondrial [Polypterus senegalus]XP_039599758.1 complex I assembly factor TIMMDC1, mitochondrial [Polypterus senegalus]XP_039599759.1 complex I assembly factor TIMMDC1, mitochondrial [Polypterus senegalus]XP_039599760.1 complex I assembly factor TIMMDC1, mitochondrial [Polypterus senegalus]
MDTKRQLAQTLPAQEFLLSPCTRRWMPFPNGLAAASTDSACAEKPSELPNHGNKPEFPDTGWDRIKELFHRHETNAFSEEITNTIKSALMAAAVGMMYGGIPAARHARKRYIEQSNAEVYRHRIEAVRSAHNAAIRGFLRYGWRWSWRVAAFVTVFNAGSIVLSVYRDKYVLGHYAAAGAITGGLFRINLGLRGLVAGSLIGGVLGVPAGALIMGMQMASGETLGERKRRERRELYELKLSEWSSRLNVTEDIITEIDNKLQNDSAKSDMEKIEDILSRKHDEHQIK